MTSKDDKPAQLKSETVPGASVSNKSKQAIVEVSIPASYDFLPLFGATVREFCASLPVFLKEENSENDPKDNDRDGESRRFGVGILQLPDSGATIESGYSHFVYSVELILQEASSNIIRHGYGGENLDASLHLTLSVEEVNFKQYALVIEVIDTAPAFNVTVAPVESPNPLELRESGYGIYLIHKLTDKLDYSRREGKNYLKMVKYLSQ
jgi:serine/threonine-protein kinase RsbW